MAAKKDNSALAEDFQEEIEEVSSPENHSLEIVDEVLDAAEKENAIKELKTHPIDQVIYGISLFRESRGEILSGSTTYFIIIASIPMLMCLSYLYSTLLGNPEVALNHVLSLLEIGVPNLDKGIFENISNVIKAQLLQKDVNYLNLFFLALSGFGFAQSIYFGLMFISDYRKDDTLQESLYSLCIGIGIGCYFTAVSLIMADTKILKEFFPSNSFINPIIDYIGEYPGLSVAIFSISCLTIFYKFMTPLKIRTRDGFLGACIFISLFAIGKTLYWVYLHYFQKELIENFGNLHSIVATTIWVYYLVGSFFLGACTAFSYGRMRNQILGIDIHEEFDTVDNEEDFQDEAIELLEQELDNPS